MEFLDSSAVPEPKGFGGREIPSAFLGGGVVVDCRLPIISSDLGARVLVCLLYYIDIDSIDQCTTILVAE